MTADLTRTYLEMTDRTTLRPKASIDPRFSISEASARQWRFNKFLYELVGEPWAWRDKLAWSEAQWQEYVACASLRTFAAYYNGSPAGYFELRAMAGDMEIVYLGLAPEFIGKGLGGPLLTRALEEAWITNPRRVWVHTCTLDHPSALANYRARGMVEYKQELFQREFVRESPKYLQPAFPPCGDGLNSTNL